MMQIVQRGFVLSDKIEFNEKNIGLLKKAQKDICFLLDRGYSIDKTIEFVGNHFLFRLPRFQYRQIENKNIRSFK